MLGDSSAATAVGDVIEAANGHPITTTPARAAHISTSGQNEITIRRGRDRRVP